MLTVMPLLGIGSILKGDDLSQIIIQAVEANGYHFSAGDVVVVAQKIVSKAEGRQRALSLVTPSQEAQQLAQTCRKDPRLVQLILEESSDVVRAHPGVLITRHRLGLVMANAGIDASNLDSDNDQVLLLPENPDHSAAQLQQALQSLSGCSLAVVVSDSFGRPWRNGVTNVAIGAAGLPALLDRRNHLDRSGRTLQVTQIALADLIASAAGLLIGEADESIPAAIVRGLPEHYRGDNQNQCPASALIRPIEEDLFR